MSFRILFWDIETTPVLGWVWGLYDQNLQYGDVEQDWHVICAAWQWLGEDEIQSVVANGKNDLPVIKKLHSLISSADAIVAHNGNRFDWGKFMARVIYHKLPPVDQPIMIDTLLQARRFKFTSNKLDDLGNILDLGRKLHVPKSKWIECAKGNKASIGEMVIYCEADIPPLVKLYERLRPYSKTSFNMNHYSNTPVCPKCLCPDIRQKGVRRTTVGMYQRYRCNGCQGWFQSTKRIRGIGLK